MLGYLNAAPRVGYGLQLRSFGEQRMQCWDGNLGVIMGGLENEETFSRLVCALHKVFSGGDIMEY